MKYFRAMAPFGLALLALGSLFFATGCSTVRQARHVQKGADAAPGERLLQPAEVGLSSNSTLTLAEALNIPLACHPQIFQAEQNLAAATARVYQVRAAYWPQLNGSAGGSRATENSEGQTKSSSYTHKSLSGSIGLDLLLYDFGKTPAVMRQAYADLVAAAETLRATRSDVAYATRNAYLNLGKALELEEVATESVRQNQIHLDQVKAFIEVGRRTRYDLTKSEVDLGNARLSQIKARNDTLTARASLNRSLGLATDPGYLLRPDFPDTSTVLTAGQYMSRIRQNHPKLMVFQARERAASAAVDEAIASLYPEIGLQAKYGLSGSGFPLTWNWSAGLRGALQLFTGHRETWRIHEAVTGLRVARARKIEQEQILFEDMLMALAQLDSSQQRLALSDLLVKQAAESLELINERFRLGAASSVEVTDAQVALTSAQAEQVRSKFDFQAAFAQLKHACGEE